MWSKLFPIAMPVEKSEKEARRVNGGQRSAERSIVLHTKAASPPWHCPPLEVELISTFEVAARVLFLFFSLSLSLSLSQRLTPVSGTIGDTLNSGSKWRASNVRKLAERTKEWAVCSFHSGFPRKKERRKKESRLCLVDVVQTMAAKCPYFSSVCRVVSLGNRDNERWESSEQSACCFAEVVDCQSLGERFRLFGPTRVSPRKHRISRSRVSLIG